MFNISKNIEIKTKFVENSTIYIIDNFYQNPDEILNLFLNIDPIVWKENEKPSYNQIYFDDRRHTLKSQKIKKVYYFLSQICNQPVTNNNDDLILTNCIKFQNSNFNDYKNNYWWPHIDSGYTGILYLNKLDHESGTNLYKNLNPNKEPPNVPEHYQPWRKKSNYELIYSIVPKYNRMVLFDGLKFPHGMNICNNDYFGEICRINQVFFFKE